MARESVEISIEGFSGPLDLLCHLVESRKMEAAKIKVAQLVRIYGLYLSKTKKASIEALADFFFMAAELLLQKTLTLLPASREFLAEEEPEFSMSEEELLERLARYRPYRAATVWLEERKVREERYFRRSAVLEEDGQEPEPSYDIGDLYFLSRIWWGLIKRRSKRTPRREKFDFSLDGAEEWDGLPEAIPEEAQIQNRIAELEEELTQGFELSLNALWALSPSVKTLVVTFLAVLEMCRMGKIAVEQETLFSDVRIFLQRRAVLRG
ncbi:MAG: segregation/condensation protein A [Synergistaceae bacterium]|jgi:segregation and condensation protein A|nr:segregation/condensation protein A [Synergistaceae bacterium]